jgi:hypothetical protein
MPCSVPLSLEGGIRGQSVVGVLAWMVEDAGLLHSAHLSPHPYSCGTAPDSHRLRLYALVSDPKGTTAVLAIWFESYNEAHEA